MPGRSPRLPPSGLSSLSQEVLLYDPKEQPPVPSKSHLTPPRPIARNSGERNSPITPAFKYKTPFNNLEEEVNIPLLSLSTPQTVRLPLTQDIGTEQIVHIDVPQSNGIGRRKSFNWLSNYPWTPTNLSDIAYDLQRPRPYTLSAEAQHAIEMPSPSPNSSKYFDTTPPWTSTSGRFLKPQKRHPFAKNFEVPQWKKMAIHTALCALAYPFLLIFVILGRGQNLFWSRLFVGAGCGILGVTLGLNLVHLAREILEAAST